MEDFEKTIIIDSIFGEVEVEYIPAHIPSEDESIFTLINPHLQSHYLAQIIGEGRWNGWNTTGETRGTALINLMKMIGERYGMSLESQI
ncbi:MAG: hypothetical protein WC117_01140 [Sphaerochaetaceae bacterium]